MIDRKGHGNSNLNTESLLPFYEQVLDFLAQSPSTEELVSFRPMPAAQQRFSELLETNQAGTLSPQEEEELDHYILIERMISLLKVKAFRHLDSPH